MNTVQAPQSDPEPRRRRVWAGALRLGVGVWLACAVGIAAVAPELHWACWTTAATITAVTLWQPAWGILLTTTIVPASIFFAPPPARVAEMFAWAFLAGWLLRLWRPLALRPWPAAIVLPASLLTAALASSWLSLTVAAAAGVPWSAIPAFLFQSIPRDYLVFSAPEAETWTVLQSLTGLGLFLATVGTTRDHPRFTRALAVAIVVSLVVLAVASVFDVVKQWSATGYADWFLMRFTERGERFSLHMADVNAAGSLYVIATAVAATFVVWDVPHRGWWMIPAALLAPAVWLAGSRSAYLGIATAVAVVVAARYPSRIIRRPLIVGVLLLTSVMTLVTLVGSGPDTQGGLRQSADLRSQFLLTSARMFVSAPIFGVGIGRYFERSADFMTPELRGLYGNENAHNYFAQQLAELGLAGGLLFLWLVVAVGHAAWHRARAIPVDVAHLALTAGTCGYLLTCITGHPLLVPEAAFPFWISLGTVASVSAGVPSLSVRRLAAAACLVLSVGIGRSVLTYEHVDEIPPEYGFHAFETADDGTIFRWLTRHSVTYIPNEPGFLRLRLRAPSRPMPRPLVLETSISGRVVNRQQLTPGERTTLDIPARPTRTAFRRVDFRVNQEWTQEVRLGQRPARRPVTVMAEEIEWIPLR